MQEVDVVVEGLVLHSGAKTCSCRFGAVFGLCAVAEPNKGETQ